MASESDHHGDTPDTYYGLERIVTGHDELLRYFEQATNRVTANGFIESVTKKRRDGAFGRIESVYKEVLIADTFFSDTINPDLILKVFCACSEHGAPCRILLLNPFCEQARVRSIMLEAEIAEAREEEYRTSRQKEYLDITRRWADLEGDRGSREALMATILPASLRRTYYGVAQLCCVLQALQRKERRVLTQVAHPENDAEMRGLLMKELGRFAELVSQVSTLDKKGLKIEVKFTSELMVLPFYIVGPHIFKGVLMPRSSSVHKPWSIYRDDPKRNDDMFEITKEVFEQAWKASLSVDKLKLILDEDNNRRTADGTLKKCIMIAYSDAHKQALERVRFLIGKINDQLQVRCFPYVAAVGEVTKESVEGMLLESYAGIALMLPDEEIDDLKLAHKPQKEGRKFLRSRLNVIHELGLMQQQFGWDKVMIVQLKEIDLDGPSNIRGLKIDKVRRNPDGGLDENDLENVLREFLQQMALVRSKQDGRQ